MIINLNSAIKEVHVHCLGYKCISVTFVLELAKIAVYSIQTIRPYTLKH